MEYLINSGHFNMLVVPEDKQFYILSQDEQSKAVLQDFLDCKDIDYQQLEGNWFDYQVGEIYLTGDGEKRQLGKDVSEEELINYFVLKKHNFGGLVAVRDMQKNKLKLFKKDKLSLTFGT